MLRKNRGIGIVIGIAIVLIVGGVFMQRRVVPKIDYTSFARCLTTNGVKMYGAYWCTHCQQQKELFGEAVKELRYIECGVPGDVRAQNLECQQAGITGYPTWEFSDGSRIRGEVSFEQIAEKTKCVLPSTTTQ